MRIRWCGRTSTGVEGAASAYKNRRLKFRTHATNLVGITATRLAERESGKFVRLADMTRCADCSILPVPERASGVGGEGSDRQGPDMIGPLKVPDEPLE